MITPYLISSYFFLLGKNSTADIFTKTHEIFTEFVHKKRASFFSAFSISLALTKTDEALC